jgi:hypothetical protein
MLTLLILAACKPVSPGDTDAPCVPATEVCNGADDDCDGEIDDGELLAFFTDADGDGYGDAEALVEACEAGDGLVADDRDCDDADGDVHPGTEDFCGDDVDQDCDGADAVCGLDGDIDVTEAAIARYGGTPSQQAGRAVLVHDLDADGDDDLVVSAITLEGVASPAWFVPGPITGEGALDDSVALTGEPSAALGWALAAGDLDGDGVEDVVISGAYGGPAFVVAGLPSADGAIAGLAWATIEPSIASDNPGFSLDVAGSDLLVGGWEPQGNSAEPGGIVALFHGIAAGPQDWTTADLVVEADAGAEEDVGYRAELADVTGDGVADVLTTGQEAKGDGGLYAVDGTLGGTVGAGDALSFLRGVDNAGTGLAAGDTNEDGYMDVLVGASVEDIGNGNAGRAYLVHGPLSGVDTLDQAAAAVIDGSEPRTSAGHAVLLADLNGDGAADVVVSAYKEDTYRGGVHVGYAPVSGYVTTDALDAHVHGVQPVQFTGWALDVGDLDGDGESGLVIGACGDATGGDGAGAIFAFE